MSAITKATIRDLTVDDLNQRYKSTHIFYNGNLLYCSGFSGPNPAKRMIHFQLPNAGAKKARKVPLIDPIIHNRVVFEDIEVPPAPPQPQEDPRQLWLIDEPLLPQEPVLVLVENDPAFQQALRMIAPARRDNAIVLENRRRTDLWEAKAFKWREAADKLDRVKRDNAEILRRWADGAFGADAPRPKYQIKRVAREFAVPPPIVMARNPFGRQAVVPDDWQPPKPEGDEIPFKVDLLTTERPLPRWYLNAEIPYYLGYSGARQYQRGHVSANTWALSPFQDYANFIKALEVGYKTYEQPDLRIGTKEALDLVVKNKALLLSPQILLVHSDLDVNYRPANAIANIYYRHMLVGEILPKGIMLRKPQFELEIKEKLVDSKFFNGSA